MGCKVDDSHKMMRRYLMRRQARFATAVDEYEYDDDTAAAAAGRSGSGSGSGGGSGQDDTEAAAADSDGDEYTVRLGPIYCRSAPIEMDK